MKSLDQVDSLQRRHPGMYYITISSVDSTSPRGGELAKMQGEVSACGICIVFMGFCLYKDTINSSQAL